MAVIRFNRDARVVDANSNFLRTVGYRSVDDIRSRHHRLFCDADYRNFWAALQRGEPFQGWARRRDAQGRPVWLEAT